MHRQQDLLHDVFGLIDRLSGSRQTAPGHRAQHRRDGAEQAVIGAAVSRDGRPHQAGPFIAMIAQAAFLPGNSADLSICYAGEFDLTKS
jgi:hypothetical protein